MANDVSTIKDRGAFIAKVAAGYLSDHVQFVKSIDKESPTAFDGANGYKSGDNIKINVPSRFTLGTGADITSTIQDVEEDSVNLTVDNQYNVPIAFSSAEIATDFGLKSWAERVLKPAMITLGNNIEKACLEQAADATYNLVGTAGSTTFNQANILAAGRKLDENGLDDYDNRFMLLNPASNADAVNQLSGLFNPNEEISKQYRNGAMGQALGFTFLRNNLLNTHTNGNDVSFEVSTTVATQGQATLVVEGLTTTTGTVTKGTVFEVAGVNQVHPITKTDLGIPQQFVVTADATADGSGVATLSVSPAMYTTGSRQNISAFPADGDAITVKTGAASTGYAQNMAYHKSSFRFVSLPLVKPDGVDMVGMESHDGMTVRIVRDYDIKTDKMILRADCLWGLANVRPEWAVRNTA